MSSTENPRQAAPQKIASTRRAEHDSGPTNDPTNGAVEGLPEPLNQSLGKIAVSMGRFMDKTRRLGDESQAVLGRAGPKTDR